VHRVLYVEDEDVNWAVTKLRLADSYELVRAHNARELFRQIRSNGPFSLILLDVQLQGSDYDGIELAKMLRGTHKGGTPHYARGVRLDAKVPIFFLTGHHRNDQLVRAGTDRIFTKPVDFNSLKQEMAQYISRASSGDDD
jgi:CheY-like chemotaxis protein